MPRRIGYVSPLCAPLPRIAVIGATTLAAAITSACGGEEEPDYGGDQPGNGSRDARQTMEVTASDFSFTPDSLSAAPREPFEVVLTNNGSAPHTFTIDEFDVDAEVAAGDETTVSVTPSDSGDFGFYCRFHKDQGMEGDITVAGAPGDAETDPGPTQAPTDDSYYDY
jgi:plastocyanin